MKFLNKVLAKKLPKLKLQDSDLGNIGLISINGKKVTFEEFSKMDNLKVKGNLDLKDSTVKELPSGLTVGGGLSLYGTAIKELPEDLKVKGGIWISPEMKKTFNAGKFKGKIRVR